MRKGFSFSEFGKENDGQSYKRQIEHEGENMDINENEQYVNKTNILAMDK